VMHGLVAQTTQAGYCCDVAQESYATAVMPCVVRMKQGAAKQMEFGVRGSGVMEWCMAMEWEERRGVCVEG
jgi:hypothetical protein